MIEKPLLVTIGRDNPDDVVKFTDSAGNEKQRMGLMRCVPYSMIERTFGDLFKYMMDPAGGDGNPPYSPSELALCTQMSSILETPDDYAIFAKRGGSLLKEPAMLFSHRVDQHLGTIVEPKTVDMQSGPLECKSLDLIVTPQFRGGASYDPIIGSATRHYSWRRC